MNWINKLYFGDNLEILRQCAPDASVEEIYRDPPFNSALLFDEWVAKGAQSGPAASQLFSAVQITIVNYPLSGS